MYQALYRVWRPQRFEDVVGQNSVIATLKNAIATDKVSHAYVFTGPRGTGKTSVAKIFAKAINCPNQVDGEPCDACDVCQAITAGALSDVIEIDAASNNGVEEVRDIRDKSRYAATQVTYKVYIIDEVHMLSTGAFNALLKTLEEPSQQVVFILATTEPHKIPATILSRVQRFDFKRITQQDIIGRLRYVLEQENITYDMQAVELIARVAQGGMRDALSLLDQTIAYDSQYVRYDNALVVSGSIAQEQLLAYSLAIYDKQTSEALTHLQSILQSGKEPSRFVEELLLFSRDLLLVNTIHHDSDLVDAALFAYKDKLPNAFLYRLIDELAKTQPLLKQTLQSDVYLEVFTLKMSSDEQGVVQVESSMDLSVIDTLKQDIIELKEKLQQNTTTLDAVPIQKKTVPTTSKSFEPNIAKIFAILAQATAVDKQRIQEDWQDILSVLPVTQRAKLNQTRILAASQNGIVVAFDPSYAFICQMVSQDETLQQALSQATQKILKHTITMECILETQWQEIRDKFIQAKQMGTLDQYINVSKLAQPVQEDSDNVTTTIIDVLSEPIKKEEPEVVVKATELFGDIVEIVEE